MVVNHMPAGPHDVLKRKESYKYSSTKQFGHFRNESRDVGTNHEGKRKNGYSFSSSGRNSGSGYSIKEEREPAEVSRKQGVEHAAASELQEFQVIDFETCDGGKVCARPEKRRKISPIVWNREEKEVRISSKNRVVPVTSLSSLQPVRSLGLHGQRANDVSQVSLSSNSGSAKHVQSLKEDKYVVICDVSCPADDSTSLSSEQSENNHGEHVHLEEDFAQAPNILLSRWASDSDSPSFSTDGEDGRGKTSSSTESGEFRREGSEGNRTKSSGSDGGRYYVGLSSGDDCSGKEFHDVDYMDTDQDHGEYEDDPSCLDSDDNIALSKVQRNINMLQSSRSVFEFERISKINEGTYGVVYKAKDKKTEEVVALKKVKMNIDRDGFPLSSLREINILLSFNHPYVVDVKEVVMGDLESVFMVMEYMEYDLKGLMDMMKEPFSIGEVKCLMLQLLEGVKYLHDNWVLHRDLKTSNLLLNKEGDLKICDFGLSRQYGDPLKPYTPLVVTLWYRAPELLLGTKQYSTAIDMWSVGCIMAELVSKQPLFKGGREVEQLDKIFRTLGTPDEKIWPGVSKLPGFKANFVKNPYNLLRKKFPATSFTGSPVLSESGFDLLNKLLTYDPEKRITAEDALRHDWFREGPLPKSDFKPTIPTCHR
ncbi:Kinase family protein [Quillaja saponaria]|uniref:cyclin-dependent kinase n=1 Tax=Quillaja saponaria TaxID=32244 RepID=A0AAD7KVK9_QUISA|nr:Kinase family protein [Quillaja saponaria]